MHIPKDGGRASSLKVFALGLFIVLSPNILSSLAHSAIDAEDIGVVSNIPLSLANSAIDLGDILGAVIKDAQIKAAYESWQKVDQEVQQCLIEEYNISPKSLANRGIKATDKRVTPYIKSCEKLIKEVKLSWMEVDDAVKQCLIGKYNISPDELAKKRIKATDRRIARRIESCREDIEKIRLQKEHEEGERQAEMAAQAEAKKRKEARRRDLTAKYGPEIADAIVSGRVLIGMTKSQVIEARGQPDRIEKIPPNDELWIYDDDRIVFEGERVTYVSV